MSKLTLKKDETGTIVSAKIDDKSLDGFVSVASTLSRGHFESTLKINFDEVEVEEYVPEPVVAPALTASFAAGSASATTKATISDIDERGNRFAYVVKTATVSTPNVGDIVSDTTAYTSGADITGVDATTNKFVALYELTSTNAVVKFLCHELTAAEIAE